MTRQAFEHMKELLLSAGFDVDEASYHHDAFGSWLVGVRTVPRHRVVWDGKDRWLVVQKETSGTFQGLPVWDDVWIERDAKDESSEQAVSKLSQFVGRS